MVVTDVSVWAIVKAHLFFFEPHKFGVVLPFDTSFSVPEIFAELDPSKTLRLLELLEPIRSYWLSGPGLNKGPALKFIRLVKGFPDHDLMGILLCCWLRSMLCLELHQFNLIDCLLLTLDWTHWSMQTEVVV